MAVHHNSESGAAEPLPEGSRSLGSLERALATALELLAQRERELVEARRAEERYRSLVEKVMDFEVRTINQVGRQIAAGRGLDELLPFVADLVRKSFGYSNVNVFLRDEAGTQMGLRATSTSYPWSLPLGTALRIGEQGIVGWVAGSGEFMVVNDVSQEPRYLGARELQLTQAELTVPVKLGDQIVGVLDIESDRLNAFDQGDLWVAHTLADQIAVALRNAELFEAERKRTRELAVMEERNRLAREIHDTIAQSLTGIILQLEAADHLVDTNLERARMRVQKATALARSSLQEARRSVWNLRPMPLEERTLIEAVRQEADRLAEDTGVQVAFQVEGEMGGLSGEMENGLYRMAQEALNNVRKHAQASHAQVRLSLRQDGVEMQVRDDGIGFDPAALKPAGEEGGFGLLGLLERARLMGGSLQVESSPGHGTAIKVQVPWKELSRGSHKGSAG